jgi:hypothetical protein
MADRLTRQSPHDHQLRPSRKVPEPGYPVGQLAPTATSGTRRRQWQNRGRTRPQRHEHERMIVQGRDGARLCGRIKPGAPVERNPSAIAADRARQEPDELLKPGYSAKHPHAARCLCPIVPVTIFSPPLISR